jgi:hypothetical protein
VDVASLFAFVSPPPPQADGASGLRGPCPPSGDQFGSALELALQGQPPAATAVQSGLPGLSGLRDTAAGVLAALTFLQATGDGGAVPNLAGDGVNADDESAADVAEDQTAPMLAAMAVAAGDAASEPSRLEWRPHPIPGFRNEGIIPAAREDVAEEPDGNSVVAPVAEALSAATVTHQPVAAVTPSMDPVTAQPVTDGPVTKEGSIPSVPSSTTRPVKPASAGHGAPVNPAPTLDGRRPSDVLPPAGIRVDGVPVAAPESVRTTDPAAGDLAPANPVPWDIPVQTKGLPVSNPVIADHRQAGAEMAPLASAGTEPGQSSPTSTTGWRVPAGAPSRGEAEPMVEAAAMPRPAPAQQRGTTVLPSAPPAAQLAAVAEPARVTQPFIPRQDDAAVIGQQFEVPELIEGKVSKAYLRGQAMDAPAPEPELAARTFAGAEPRAAGDRPPEREGRHHQGARQPLAPGSFIENLTGGGGLGQVFSVRTPESPGGESGPVRQEPTSGGEPLDQAIVKSLKVQWNQGVGEARLRLHPEFLGDLSVSLRVIGASVTAVLQSDSPAVREWLQAHQGDLRRALEEAGLSLDNLVVDEDGHPQDQHQQSAQDGHRRPARQKPEAGRFEALL